MCFDIFSGEINILIVKSYRIMHILVSVPQGKKCTRKGKEVLLILISILELFLMQVHAIPPVQCTSHPLLAYRYLSKFFIIKRTCKQLYASCFIRII